MYKNILPIIIGLLLLSAFRSRADHNDISTARPDGHAPISIMGDHYHSKGDWMFSYRYMPMHMEGNLQGKDDIDDASIYKNYMAAPQNMKMHMHMLGIMYAPSDRYTLMFMTNVLNNEMSLKTRMGMDFETASSGFGDMSLSALIKVLHKTQNSFHVNVGMSIPTGNIEQSDNTPMMDDARLAYPMQLGSGTWDPYLGFTYFGMSTHVSWGLQSLYKFRLGENSQKYTLGNRYDLNGWLAFKVTDYFSLSTSINYYDLEGIEGKDQTMNPMMMPLFNTQNSGKKQVDLGLGINFLVLKGAFRDLRLAAELKHPIYQKVEGVQMKTSSIATLGVQYSFSKKNKLATEE